LQRRTGSETYDKIHSGREFDEVTGFALRRFDSKFAGWFNDNVHEAIEGDWNLVRGYAKWCESLFQISEAAVMRILIIIDDLERLARAGRQQEIMPANCIFADAKHDIASVRVNRVPRRQV
jgi:hypothetical protein